MAAATDLYRVIDVPATAPSEAIKAKLDELDRIWLNRKNGAAILEKRQEAERMTVLLSEARKTLLDPKLRSAYDRTHGVPARKSQPVSPPPPPPAPRSPSSQGPSAPPVPTAQPRRDNQSSRPIGKQRKMGRQSLVFVLSISVYGYYWIYKSYEETKQYNGEGIGGLVGTVLWFVFPYLTLFYVPLQIKTMYERDGRHSPVGPTTAFWAILLIVPWWYKCQMALNEFWASKGAPPAVGI